MFFTQTKGNRQNGIKGTRITVWATSPSGLRKEKVGDMVVNAHNGLQYVSRHPAGSHAAVFGRLCLDATERETAMREDEDQRREWHEQHRDEPCEYPEFLLCNSCPLVDDCTSYARVTSKAVLHG
jgi:hypothetical protein